MTAHKRKEWYIVAKNKRLTNKEKQARAELKKRMQDKGVLPPDKPKLNRKKFIDEAREEWNGRSSDCFIWEHYLMDAMEIKVSEGTASFNSELQNDPIDPESATFNPEWFDYYEPELMDFSSPEFVFVGANDPSLGKNKKSDTSSIINLALSTKTGYMYERMVMGCRQSGQRCPEILMSCSNA